METFKGYIDHFLFNKNGYGVFELDTGEEDLICVGNFAGIDQGEMVEVAGDFVDHPIYGIQLKIEKIEVIEPDGVIDIERYLASGAIKGVGPTIAKRIVKKFGEDTLRIIDEEPERLAEIKGISERIAIEIGTQVLEKKELRDTVIYMQKYGISNKMALKLYDRYGNLARTFVEENPYKFAEEVDGIGFKKADEIAKKVGIKVDSVYRIKCGIEYVLSEASMDGHVYLPKEEVLGRAYELLGVPETEIEDQLSNLMMDKRIVIKEEEGSVNCYLSMMYYEELACARMLHELNLKDKHAKSSDIEKKLAEIEKSENITIDDKQRQAVEMAVNNSMFILTGGPGTGKTTTINIIIKYFYEKGLDIMLAAPTGRAAKRMTETTGYEAKTIHRMLELNGEAGEGGRARFERNEESPLEADVVIIDEMSMVDIHLFYALLKAIIPGTRLILVGDKDQLPSVGPGRVLKDLLDSNAFARVELTTIFRQAEESDIVVNAHKINKGEGIALDNKSKDFFFLERNSVDVIYKHLVLLITEKLPSYVNATPIQIQVLTPTRIGELGVKALNEILQRYINPPKASKTEYSYGETLFREGDKVMQIKNNYKLEWNIVSKYGVVTDQGMGIFNGDMGMIKEINTSAKTMEVEFDEKKTVKYSLSDLDELELAYAVTIHKSQGSEYPAVIMPLMGGPRQLLTRNLLYTGVTRAKKCVTILGTKETVNRMIANEDERRRYTGLSSRIREVEREG